MNNYLIMDAISCLDTDLLADHLKIKNELRMSKKTLKISMHKWCLPIVASLSLFLVIVMVILNNMGFLNSEDSPIGEYGYTANASFYYCGDVSASELGTIKYLKHDDNSVTLLINKITDDYLYATLYGYTENKQTNDYIVYCATTKTDYEDELVVLVENGIKIHVNGELVSNLPQKKGEYEVKIVFDELKNKCERLGTGIFINGFDYFVVNPLYVYGFNPDDWSPNNNDSPIITGERGVYYEYLY